MQELVLEGNPSLIIQIMKRHSSNKDAQSHGCAALAGLMVEEDETKDSIVSAGGIEAVIQAMQTHPQSADVQQHGCAALIHVNVGPTHHVVQCTRS